MFSREDHVPSSWTHATVGPWMLLGITLAGCGGGKAGASDPTTVSDSFAVVQTIFDNHCVGCHGGATPDAGMSLEAGRSYASIVGVDTLVFCPGGKRVVPGDPDGSCLYHLVAAGQMPPTGTLDDVLVDTIRAWIAAGAKDAAGHAPAAGGPYALKVASTDFGPHDTQTVYAALVSTSDGSVVGGPALQVVGSGAFTFDFGAVLDPTQSYTVEYFADLDASASCGAADHGWSLTIDAPTHDVTLGVSHADAQADVCATFAALATAATTAEVTAVFAARCTGCHGGATPQADLDLTADHAEASLVGVATQLLCQPGGTRVVAGDPDASCLWQMVGTDYMPQTGAKLGFHDKQKLRSWIAAGAGVVAPSPSTGPYALTLSGSAFGPHNGQTLQALVLRTSDGAVVAGPSAATVTGGVFSFTWPGVGVTGETYEARYWVDFNGNGVCDAPSADHAWARAFPAVTGDTTLPVTHNTTFTNVCAVFPVVAYALTLSGAGFTPHDGQTVHAVAVRSSNGAVVGAPKAAVVTAGAFSVSWPSMAVAGVDYEARYYVDVNGNSACDPPGTDHSWVAPFPAVSGDTTLAVTHSTTFAGVCGSF